MKVTGILAVAAVAFESVSAHYIFQQLKVGSTQYSTWQNIRQHTNGNSPVIDLASNDLRCNVGAKASTTAPVKAGDTVTFKLDTPVYHQGPTSFYLSKAPGSVSSYDGSGGWFKIKDIGPTFSGGQASWALNQEYSVTIPSCIASGEYLLRVQQLGIHNPYPGGIPQFYLSCAQISVTGGSGSRTPATVSIPGAFKATDPGYTANIYTNFNSYTVPGPTVFTC